MNYRHIYHAGNFADVIKHLTLLCILKQLKQKPKAFAVLDSFAGIGEYNLFSEQATKSNESDQGIKLLTKFPGKMPMLLSEYCDYVKSLNISSNHIEFYPGSPLIIADHLREPDRLVANELHPEDFYLLKQNIKNKANCAVHNLDGYLTLKSLLPFKENRGLILLDPPFEVKNEFEKLLEGVKLIYSRFAQGITAIWYPIKDPHKVKAFFHNLKEEINQEILRVEFALKDHPTNMRATGLAIINPPFIKHELEENLIFLRDNIYQKRASFKIETILKK